MSELRKAAQAAPDAKVRAQHKEFARWFLELSDKSALASEYLAWLAWKAALAHPPRDEWRPASDPPEDLRRRVIAWRSPPQRQSGTWVEALYDDGAWVTRDGIAHDVTHWRDVTPPTEGAK